MDNSFCYEFVDDATQTLWAAFISGVCGNNIFCDILWSLSDVKKCHDNRLVHCDTSSMNEELLVIWKEQECVIQENTFKIAAYKAKGCNGFYIANATDVHALPVIRNAVNYAIT
jgi:hypothetical protein